MNPKISIIMATFNRAHLIEETLVSIQNQTYSNWECLIIDDESTDNTKAVLESYTIKDSRFQYYKRPEPYRKGLPGCRNYGLDIAKGEYVIFFDDDDIVHPQNLELCTRVFESNEFDFCVYKKQSFTGSFTGAFKPQSVVQDPEAVNLYNFLTNKAPIASCTVMWHISCFDTIRFNEELMYAEEWECYTRILITNKEGAHLKNTLYFNRKHSQSNTGEFWNNDPVRRYSKVQAVKLVIKHLSEKRLIDYKLSVYFLSLAHFLKENSIYNHLMSVDTKLKLLDKHKLFLRHQFRGIIKPIYRFKRNLKNKF